MAKLNNEQYDIVSVIYNASQAVETCSQYMKDAEKQGDKEVKQFFSEVQQQNESLITKGRDLLKSRL